MRENYVDQSGAIVAYIKHDQLFRADGLLIGNVRREGGEGDVFHPDTGERIVAIGHDHLFDVIDKTSFASLQLSEIAE
ncbi:hypothetical protein [Sphingomonas koreensis]